MKCGVVAVLLSKALILSMSLIFVHSLFGQTESQKRTRSGRASLNPTHSHPFTNTCPNI
jgi:hypothetical protein